MPSQEENIQEFVQSGPDPSQSDEATQILSDLFGNEWWKVLWSGEGIQGEPSLIFPILEIFNYVVLLAVAILLVYIVGHAFVGSAHEGTPLGSRMHSIWVPIRAVLSMSLLAPIPWAKSLSVIQGLVLAFVGFSIQFGNMVASTGLQYISENHGQVVSSTPKGITEAGTEVAEVALHNFLIQYHQHYFQDKPLNAGYKDNVNRLDDPAEENIGTHLNSGGTHFVGGRGHGETVGEETPSTQKPTKVIYKFKAPKGFGESVMGKVTLSCSEDPNKPLCQSRRESLENLLEKMEKFAAQRIRLLANVDGATEPGEGKIEDAIASYGSGLMQEIHDLVESQNSALQQELELFTHRVEDQGFVMLGSYFWTLTRFNMAILDQVNSKVSAEDFNKDNLKNQISPKFNQILTNVKSVDGYFRGAKYSNDDIARMGAGDINEDMEESNFVQSVVDKISRWFTGWTDSYIAAITSHDPIAGLSAWGHGFMNGTYSLLTTMSAVHAVPYVGKAALPYILFIVPPLFVLSFTLAYYLPSVPFILWISGIFGWLIMVIEALIAAPIWAAMHANPDGEGIAGDSGSQGYTLFIQVLMRPPLMVIGFFFALLLLTVISQFGDMFTIFFTGLSANESFAGPVTAMAGIILGTTIIVILVHKAFSLIYALPEGLMKWMGAKGSHISKGGESADASATQSYFVGGVVSRGSSAGGGAAGKAMESDKGSSSTKNGSDSGGDDGGGSDEMSDNAKNTSDDQQSGEVPQDIGSGNTQSSDR